MNHAVSQSPSIRAVHKELSFADLFACYNGENGSSHLVHNIQRVAAKIGPTGELPGAQSVEKHLFHAASNWGCEQHGTALVAATPSPSPRDELRAISVLAESLRRAGIFRVLILPYDTLLRYRPAYDTNLICKSSCILQDYKDYRSQFKAHDDRPLFVIIATLGESLFSKQVVDAIPSHRTYDALRQEQNLPNITPVPLLRSGGGVRQALDNLSREQGIKRHDALTYQRFLATLLFADNGSVSWQKPWGEGVCCPFAFVTSLSSLAALARMSRGNDPGYRSQCSLGLFGVTDGEYQTRPEVLGAQEEFQQLIPNLLKSGG